MVTAKLALSVPRPTANEPSSSATSPNATLIWRGLFFSGVTVERRGAVPLDRLDLGRPAVEQDLEVAGAEAGDRFATAVDHPQVDQDAADLDALAEGLLGSG
jgi:hypothetical protein